MLPIPEEWRDTFYPASHYIYEWETYWVHCPGADRLRVGAGQEEAGDILPLADGLFPVRFENRLGLAKLQPFAGGEPLEAPFHLEVLSPKFGTLEAHRQFYGALLDELFTSAAGLPFTLSAPTARGVAPASSSPSPLFTYHLLLQSGDALLQALAAVIARPHRSLEDRRVLVPLSGASDLGADFLTTVTQNSAAWQPASGFPLAEALGGFAPPSVWQRQPEETLDTPENQFVQALVQTLVLAARVLPDQPWWHRVPAKAQRRLQEMAGEFRQLSQSGIFGGVGPMRTLPTAGLLRRDGYRELLGFWLLLTSARQPLFGLLQEAIDLRDIATLYEIWVFFRLVEELGVLWGRQGSDRPGSGKTSPGRDFDLRIAEVTGPGWRAEVHSGAAGTLIYNQSYHRSGSPYESYSVPLRPDFTWMVDGRPEVVLDAKFRLDRPPVEGEDEFTPATAARQSDLYKMHAYRDSLGVRAAVVLYPGDTAVFYHRRGEADTGVRVPQLLRQKLTGVGAIPLRPLLPGGAPE